MTSAVVVAGASSSALVSAAQPAAARERRARRAIRVTPGCTARWDNVPLGFLLDPEKACFIVRSSTLELCDCGVQLGSGDRLQRLSDTQHEEGGAAADSARKEAGRRVREHRGTDEARPERARRGAELVGGDDPAEHD